MMILNVLKHTALCNRIPCLIALKKGILNFQNFDSYQASLLNSFENINIIIYGTLEIQGGCLNSKIALM